MQLWLKLLVLASALPAITLEQALQEALQKHPLLAVSQSRIDVSTGKLQQARLRPNPLFIYQTEDFRTWKSPGHRFWQDADHFFYLQQTFETASKRARRVDVAQANEKRTAIELTLQKQTIAARVRAAYWDAVGTKARESMLREAYRNLDAVTEYHRIQVREGAMAEADLLRVELEEQKILLLANAASVEAQKAQIRLQREMGRAATEELALELPIDAMTPGFAAGSLDAALEQRAEAQLAKQIILVAGAQVQLESALATPNVDGVAGYKRSRTFDTMLWGVQTQLPIFNRNEGNIASATAEERLARNALVSTEALIRSEYAGALRELELRTEQLKKSVLPLRERAQEINRLAREAYRLGGADLLRLIDALRNQLDTEQLYIEAQVALRQAEAAVQTAMGVLP